MYSQKLSQLQKLLMTTARSNSSYFSIKIFLSNYWYNIFLDTIISKTEERERKKKQKKTRVLTHCIAKRMETA
jgi:hypothetical protein